MQKRISALLLAMVIVIGSVLGGNTLKVKAASVAVSEEFAVELTMMLYNLLETVAISSGIKDGLDDYISIHAPARGATSIFAKKFSSLLAKIV